MSPNDGLPEVPPPEAPADPPPKVFIVKTIDLRQDGKAVVRSHTRTFNRAHAVSVFIQLCTIGENAWLMATDDPAPIEG